MTRYNFAGRQLRGLVVPGGQAHWLVLDSPVGGYLLAVRGLGQAFIQRVVKH